MSVDQDDRIEEAMRVEQFKHELAIALEDHKAALSRAEAKRRVETEKLMAVWRAVFEYAQIAIRTVIIANGAGAIAILTYLGRAAEAQVVVPVRGLGLAAGVFGLGVAAGFLATIFAY